MYLIGYDIGSSSIKAALVDAESGRPVAVVQSPASEMDIHSVQADWAEQDPEIWWQHVCRATRQLLDQTQVPAEAVKGIGISYQMHGLVLVDEDQQALRPAIIWCDSRAVATGDQAFEAIGPERCLHELLNSPGNFTASKLRWVQEQEPELYRRIHKFMLPGDYIAMRLTGEIRTTPSGLSEGVFWDFQRESVSNTVMDFYDFEKALLPDISPTFSLQGNVTPVAATATGLSPGTPVSYRAGDQPNNALSLNVLQPGEIAATGGTSGVIYSVVGEPLFDPLSRVNSFAHVNHQSTQPRIGVLLCINGAGSQYNWVRKHLTQGDLSYPEMEAMAAQVPVGAEGLRILPFGNGAERLLRNRNIGARISNLQFNRHSNAHLFRAALEGIAFSFVYGVSILQEMGLEVSIMRVGNDNLFQSAIFSNTISTLLGCNIEVVETTGAVGAAKAAGVATGIYHSVEEAVQQVDVIKTYTPQQDTAAYKAAYTIWENELNNLITGAAKPAVPSIS